MREFYQPTEESIVVIKNKNKNQYYFDFDFDFDFGLTVTLLLGENLFIDDRSFDTNKKWSKNL